VCSLITPAIVSFACSQIISRVIQGNVDYCWNGYYSLGMWITVAAK
jgi:hypothetical protein